MLRVYRLNGLSPVASLEVCDRALRPGAVAVCSAIVDTASTRTAIPLSVLESLGVLPSGYVIVEDFQGKAQPVPLYRVTVRIQGLGDFDLDAMLTERAHAALGWDVLSKFAVSLRLS